MSFSLIPPLLFLLSKKVQFVTFVTLRRTGDTSQDQSRPVWSQTRPEGAQSPLAKDFTTVNFHADDICAFMCLTKTEKARETLQWCGCVCVSECVCVCVCVSEKVLQWCYLRHSVHQRRGILFVLLHPSVSVGSLMVMAWWTLATGTDATLG